MRLAIPVTSLPELPHRIGDAAVPQDAVSNATWAWAHRRLPRYVLAHSVRGYAWAVTLGRHEDPTARASGSATRSSPPTASASGTPTTRKAACARLDTTETDSVVQAARTAPNRVARVRLTQIHAIWRVGAAIPIAAAWIRSRLCSRRHNLGGRAGGEWRPRAGRLPAAAQRIALVDNVDRVDLLAAAVEPRRQERQAIPGVAVAGFVRMRPLLALGPVAALLPEHDLKSRVG